MLYHNNYHISHYDFALQLQKTSDTVFGVVFFGSKHLLRGYLFGALGIYIYIYSLISITYIYSLIDVYCTYIT